MSDRSPIIVVLFLDRWRYMSARYVGGAVCYLVGSIVLDAFLQVLSSGSPANRYITK